MNFATWSIRNPVPTILIFGLLALMGFWGFHKLPIQDFPDIDLPTVTVTLSQPGAAPAQLETEIARKVEDSLATLEGLKHLRTTISNGRVSIVVEFDLRKNLSDAVNETKNAVDRTRGDLPSDMQPPVVTAVTVAGQALMVYAIRSSRMDEEALSWFVDDTVARAVLGVQGVGRFDRIGGVQREIRVEIDGARLTGVGATAAQVSRTLRQVQQESSGGRGQLGGTEQSIRTIATVRDATDLAALPIALTNGRDVRLDEIAAVSDGVAERTQGALLNGNPVVGFRLYRSRGYDQVAISDGVQKALHDLAQSDPTLEITLVNNNVRYILDQYKGSMDLLYEGAFLAVLVVFLFLRDWRATFVAATALPLSILPTFAAMSWLGYSLNTLTLLALAVIVGILVDDAIVEIENVERHAHTGKPIIKATEDAVNEIALAVIATTLSLVVVFFPTTLMGGIPGLFFQQFGWTVVIAVLASLLVARLLTPMMAAYMLRPKKTAGAPKTDGPIMQWYLKTASWCLQHRKTTVTASAVFFFGSMALLPLIPTGVFPVADRGITNVSMELPPGSPYERTADVAEQARVAVSGIPGVQEVFTTIGEAQMFGGGSGRAGEVRRASLLLVLSPRGARGTQVSIETEARQRLLKIAGARFTVGFGGSGEKMQLTLASSDNAALRATAQALERDLRTVGPLSNVTSTASLERPEIIIRPNAQLAADRGVTAAAIGEVVRIATGGDFDQQVAKLNLDNRQVYVRVLMNDQARTDIETFGNLRVPARNGLVPLSSIADISLENGPSQIDRFDRSRYVTVNADLGGMALGSALAAANTLPAMRDMPSTVRMIRTGDAEFAAELMSGFVLAIVTGVVCIFCVLVLLFKDFLQPVTILSALPLSVGGAFVAVLLAGSELGVPTMIGLVALMGIVSKNSILLVDYAVTGMRERGLGVHEAVVDACHKRARPIVMTSVAMIAGMTPIALGLGADSSFRRPMALAVIGGLATSTALSLLVVPVVFVYVHRFGQWIGRLTQRFRPSTAET